MDLLFASKSSFVWDEEKSFRKLKAEMETSGKGIYDVVEGREVSSRNHNVIDTPNSLWYQHDMFIAVEVLYS